MKIESWLRIESINLTNVFIIYPLFSPLLTKKKKYLMNILAQDSA